MNSLICPISTEKVNKSVVRITGFLVASTIVLYAATGSLFLVGLLFIDFTIRAFTPLKFSPYSWLASKISKSLHLSVKPIDKAPKLFASRVGFLFATAIFALHFVSPLAALVVGLVLMTFALLESLFDFCVGCVVYTYLVLPLNNRSKKNKTNKKKSRWTR